MKIGNLDTRDKVMIVAEIGNNHEGSVELARQLVDKAADAGVDAVKFQTFKTETFVSPHDVDRFNRMKSFELTTENFEELAIRARNNGLLFISTPLDMPSATFLIKLVDALKIASGDNTFNPLIELVSRYTSSSDGFLRRRDRPLLFQSSILGRLPPIQCNSEIVTNLNNGFPDD